MFNKKLDELSSLLKQFKASIKAPKMDGVKPMKTSVPKLPGLPSASKKDPVKVAQQIENADVKPIAVKAAKQKKESLQISKSGQWSMANHQEDTDGSVEKAGGVPSGYHIHQDGHRITSKPMSLKDLTAQHGSVKHLESKGFKVMPHYGKLEKSNPMRSYKFKPAATADGHSSYHAYHDGNHVGTLSVNHKDNSVSGQIHDKHEGNRDFLNHAVKAFHIAKHTNTDN